MKPLSFLKNIHNRSVSIQLSALVGEIVDAVTESEDADDDVLLRVLTSAGRIMQIVRSDVYDGEAAKELEARINDGIAAAVSEKGE